MGNTIFFGMTIEQIFWAIGVIAIVVGIYWRLKIDVNALEIRLKSLEIMVKDNRLRSEEDLKDHKEDNKDSMETMRKENREDHIKILDKLDMIVIKGKGE